MNWSDEDAARFWEKVDPADCWTWSATQMRGYGYFRYSGRFLRAHRVAYQLLVGPIPEGLHLDHLCRNKLCVNPDHLEPVTNRTNVLRGVSVPAKNARKTHCKRGHELTGDNLIPNGARGGRSCRICHNERYRTRTTEPEAASFAHGTLVGYAYHRCRCGPCRQAKASARAARIARKNPTKE